MSVREEIENEEADEEDEMDDSENCYDTGNIANQDMDDSVTEESKDGRFDGPFSA